MRSDDEIFALVHAKADAIQRRRRRRAATTALVIVTAVVAVVVPALTEDPREEVRAAGTTSTTLDEAGRFGYPVGVDRCFPRATGRIASSDPLSRRVAGWPTDAPAVLVLGSDGAVWVVDGPSATRWTGGTGDGPGAPGYAWARWSPDGNILASRLVGDSAVRIDRLLGPGRAEVALELPFTVQPDAPAGYCPIDGYLLTFAVSPQGITLLRHQPGPQPHSCPLSMGPLDDPWRCAFPEVVMPEFRPFEHLGDGQTMGLRSGHLVAVMADSTGSTTFALNQNGSVQVLRPGATAFCCFAGREAFAVALSPEGDRWAFTIDGNEVVVASLESPDAGRPLWRSTNGLGALAWAGEWIVAAEPSSLMLVSTTDGAMHELDGFDPGAIVSLDALEQEAGN
ncbi:MAG: hypothetical protein ACT4PX_09425 [Actinomycetota bacterium]